MKYILSIISILLVSFSFFWNLSQVNSEDWGVGWSEIPYCSNWDCWLNEWIVAIKDISAIETTRSASNFIQDVVQYILWFLFLLAVLIIIYAWFNLLFWVWDEEKAKSTKKIIIYAIIWIVIIYLAWPISDFIFKVLSATPPPTP